MTSQNPADGQPSGAAELLSGEQGGAGPPEAVEDDVAADRAVVDGAGDELDGLHRRVVGRARRLVDGGGRRRGGRPGTWSPCRRSPSTRTRRRPAAAATPQIIFGMALQRYFALVEEHARDVVRELSAAGVDVKHLLRKNRKPLEDNLDHYPPSDSIETWGTKLLELLERTWHDVKPNHVSVAKAAEAAEAAKEAVIPERLEAIDGCAALAEASVVRNAFAHGAMTASSRMVNRVGQVKGHPPWPESMNIVLDYKAMCAYRDRLRSFARVFADAAVQCIKAEAAVGKGGQGQGRLARRRRTCRPGPGRRFPSRWGRGLV